MVVRASGLVCAPPPSPLRCFEMSFGKNWRTASVRHVLLCGLFFLLFEQRSQRPRGFIARAEGGGGQSGRRKKSPAQDDSFTLVPAKDLALQPENARKADALVDFVEGVPPGRERGDGERARGLSESAQLRSRPGRAGASRSRATEPAGRFSARHRCLEGRDQGKAQGGRAIPAAFVYLRASTSRRPTRP